MEETIKHWTFNLSFLVEAVAALIIGWAVLQATWQAFRVLLGVAGTHQGAREQIRMQLARWLAVSLEFALAADILRTAVAPSWDEIGKLAAIAILRTLLNHFLDQEIRQELREEAKQARKIEQEG